MQPEPRRHAEYLDPVPVEAPEHGETDAVPREDPLIGSTPGLPEASLQAEEPSQEA